jgi:PCFT/HCP family folate transporter-like MFS transporter 1/3
MFTGTVFAFTSVVEALTPIAASPLYTFVYNATLLTFSGAFYILSSALYALAVVLLRFVVACRNFMFYLIVDTL